MFNKYLALTFVAILITCGIVPTVVRADDDTYSVGRRISANPFRYVGEKVTLICKVALIWDPHWFTATECGGIREIFVSWPTNKLSEGDTVELVGKVIKPLNDNKDTPTTTLHGLWVGGV